MSAGNPLEYELVSIDDIRRRSNGGAPKPASDEKKHAGVSEIPFDPSFRNYLLDIVYGTLYAGKVERNGSCTVYTIGRKHTRVAANGAPVEKDDKEFAVYRLHDKMEGHEDRARSFEVVDDRGISLTWGFRDGKFTRLDNHLGIPFGGHTPEVVEALPDLRKRLPVSEDLE
ncbi:MAG: hypothetical protein NT120_05070 [Candidatus Aenigmarchaeota archaeon]|nr:hypothetical protein [Candidatus Aenigmarchaeota archaeon]